MPTVRDSRGREIRDSGGREVYSGSGRDSDSGSRSYGAAEKSIKNEAEKINQNLKETESKVDKIKESVMNSNSDSLKKEYNDLVKDLKQSKDNLKEIQDTFGKDSHGAGDRESKSVIKDLNDALKEVHSWEKELNMPVKETVMDKLKDITKNRASEYLLEIVEEYVKGGVKDKIFTVAKTITAGIKPANAAIKGLEKVSNAYDKVDKTEEINLSINVYNDIKEINLEEHKPDETGYKFVEYVQNIAPEQYSQEEIQAFHEKSNLYADMIEEGY